MSDSDIVMDEALQPSTDEIVMEEALPVAFWKPSNAFFHENRDGLDDASPPVDSEQTLSQHSCATTLTWDGNFRWFRWRGQRNYGNIMFLGEVARKEVDSQGKMLAEKFSQIGIEDVENSQPFNQPLDPTDSQVLISQLC